MITLEAYNGFEELQKELSRIAKKISNQQVRKEALEEGGKIIADKASDIVAASAKHPTGRLKDGIVVYGFDEKTEDITIGWGEDAFYGKILENGFVPLSGKEIKSNNKRKQRTRNSKSRKSLLSGKSKVYLKHLSPAYEQEKERAVDAIYKKILKEIDTI